MSDVTIHRTSGPLARQSWRFWYDDHSRRLTLDEYVSESRPSTRHRNWTELAGWSRISAGRFGHRRTNAGVPPLPDDVAQEAIETFRLSISVGMPAWWVER